MTQLMAISNELTLLQFVALALPAVAILMQAVLNFHEIYDDSHSETVLRTEFRLLEFTFLGLVIASALFSAQILMDVESVLTKFGILFMWAGLGLIFPATWFALRRAKYPTENYDSPEELVRQTTDTGKRVLLPILAVVIILFGISRISAIATLETRFLQIGIDDIISVLTIILIIITTQTVASNIIDYFAQRIEQKEQKRQLSRPILDIHVVTRKQIPESDLELIQERISEINDIQSDLIQIRSRYIEYFSDETNDKVSDLQKKLNDLGSCYENLERINKKIEHYRNQQTQAQETIVQAGQKLSATPDNEAPSALFEDMTNAGEYIDKVDKEISGLEDSRTQIIEEIEELNHTLTDITTELRQTTFKQ